MVRNLTTRMIANSWKLFRLGSLQARSYNGEPMPDYANGKICYIEMPAADISRSAEFYQRVFGWNVRRRPNGSTAFDDTTGQVSGSWVLGRPPASSPGLMLYVMVDSVEKTLESIIANGGE